MKNLKYRFNHGYGKYHFYILVLGVVIWILYSIIIIVNKFRKDYNTISMDLYDKNQGTYEEEIAKIKANEL